MDVIRWAHAAYTSKGAFPETVPIELIRALQGQSNKDNHRVCTGQDNEVLFDTMLLLTLTRYPLFNAEARLTCRAEVSPCESGQGLTTVMT